MPTGFLFAALILLPFLSKVSFRWLSLFPEKISIFWLQGGLHPLMNSILTVTLLVLLAMKGLKPFPRTWLMKVWMSCLLVLVVILWAQAALQWTFLDLNVSGWLHISGSILTTLLLLGYGLLIPNFGKTEDLFRLLTWAVRISLAFSFVLLILRPDLTFKGSRFIGVFKHIPYMVTCGQLGLLVEWNNIVTKVARARLWSVFFLVLSLLALVLTGTRSAALCGLVFLLLGYWKWPLKSEDATWLKRSTIYLGLLFVITLGPFAVEQLEAYMRGQSSFGLRTAQDGIASRMEEIERGSEIFKQEPWLGHGLLYRFGSENLESAGSYDSFRDPHNIVVSAGVIGGWPLITFVCIGLVLLAWVLVKKLFEPVLNLHDYQIALLSAYLLSHLPILAVYHMHLSLGGLADRVYWLFLGFVLSQSKVRQGGMIYGKIAVPPSSRVGPLWHKDYGLRRVMVWKNS